MLKAGNVARDNLLSLGTCFGKFTKTGKFRLHVTALDYAAQYAQYKIWIKPNGEMPFLYGNHVLKAHVGRMSEDIEQYSGVVLFNMADVPLVRPRHAPPPPRALGLTPRSRRLLEHFAGALQGFGVATRSTVDCRKLDPTAIVAFHQADIGEYLRSEDTLT